MQPAEREWKGQRRNDTWIGGSSISQVLTDQPQAGLSAIKRRFMSVWQAHSRSMYQIGVWLDHTLSFLYFWRYRLSNAKKHRETIVIGIYRSLGTHLKIFYSFNWKIRISNFRRHIEKYNHLDLIFCKII